MIECALLRARGLRWIQLDLPWPKGSVPGHIGRQMARARRSVRRRVVISRWVQLALAWPKPSQLCRCGEPMVKDEAARIPEYPLDVLWLCGTCRAECWRTAEGE